MPVVLGELRMPDIEGRLGNLSECVAGDDFVSWPEIGSPTSIEHQKKVAVFDCRQAMRNDKDRHVSAQFGQMCGGSGALTGHQGRS